MKRYCEIFSIKFYRSMRVCTQIMLINNGKRIVFINDVFEDTKKILHPTFPAVVFPIGDDGLYVHAYMMCTCVHLAPGHLLCISKYITHLVH